MTITEGLRTHLLSNSAWRGEELGIQISAMVGARIYPLLLPQTPKLDVGPAIVFQKISQMRLGHLRGQGSLARPRIQIDSWATRHDTASALAALVRRRLEGFTGEFTDGGSPAVTARVTIFFDTDMDIFDPDILGGVFRNSADYFIYHSTAEGVL